MGYRMEKIKSMFILFIGILLVLPLVGFNALGTLTEGVLAWILAIVVLIYGIIKISESFR